MFVPSNGDDIRGPKQRSVNEEGEETSLGKGRNWKPKGAAGAGRGRKVMGWAGKRKSLVEKRR